MGRNSSRYFGFMFLVRYYCWNVNVTICMEIHVLDFPIWLFFISLCVYVWFLHIRRSEDNFQECVCVYTHMCHWEDTEDRGQVSGVSSLSTMDSRNHTQIIRHFCLPSLLTILLFGLCPFLFPDSLCTFGFLCLLCSTSMASTPDKNFPGKSYNEHTNTLLLLFFITAV